MLEINISESEKLDNDIRLFVFRYVDLIQRKMKKLKIDKLELSKQLNISDKYLTSIFMADKIDIKIIVQCLQILNINYKIVKIK